uniref:Uncharacterized protein n=1 Tax=Fagus sylvatica TaxID=28930 RepID=A0A2N9FD45_FAGSY
METAFKILDIASLMLHKDENLLRISYFSSVTQNANPGLKYSILAMEIGASAGPMLAMEIGASVPGIEWLGVLAMEIGASAGPTLAMEIGASAPGIEWLGQRR